MCSLSVGDGWKGQLWPHLGMSAGPTLVKRIFVRRVLAPPAAGQARDGFSSIVANLAGGEEQVNVERPQRQRGRTTLTGEERRPSSATRWGQMSFVIMPSKIGKWGRNSSVGGSKLVLETIGDLGVGGFIGEVMRGTAAISG